MAHLVPHFRKLCRATAIPLRELEALELIIQIKAWWDKLWYHQKGCKTLSHEGELGRMWTLFKQSPGKPARSRLSAPFDQRLWLQRSVKEHLSLFIEREGKKARQPLLGEEMPLTVHHCDRQLRCPGCWWSRSKKKRTARDCSEHRVGREGPTVCSLLVPKHLSHGMRGLK